MRRALVVLVLVGCKEPAPMLVDGPVGGDDAAIEDAAVVDDAPPDAFTGFISDQARSGTRLKMHWWVTPDGVFYPSGSYYDSELATVCKRDPFSDGNDYCAPEVVNDQIGVFGYTDPACTQFTYRVSKTVTAPVFRGVRAPDRAWTTIYRVGPVHEPVLPGDEVPRYFWKIENGTCVERRTSGWDHDITELSFVQLTTTTEGTGRLQELRDVGADGFSMIQRQLANDSELSAVCSLSQSSMTTQICTPVGTRTTLAYGDSACTQQIVYNPGHSGTFALVGSIIHAIGAPNTNTYRYRKNANGSCTAISGQASQPYSNVGAALAPLAEDTRELAPATGKRLRPYSWAATDFSILSGIYYDTSLDLDCQASSSGCSPFPSGRAAERKFSDSLCTVPLDVYVHGTGSVPLFAWTENDQLKPVEGLRPSSSLVFIITGAPPTGCEIDFELAGFPIYNLGAALDLSLLETMTEVSDP